MNQRTALAVTASLTVAADTCAFVQGARLDTLDLGGG